MQNDKATLIDSIKSLYRLYLNAVRFPAEFFPRRFQWTSEQYEEERPELVQGPACLPQELGYCRSGRKELLRVAFQNGFPVPDPWLTVRFYGTSPWPVRFFRADGQTFISDEAGKPCRAEPGQTMAEWTDTGPDFPALAAVMQEMKLAIMRLEAENQPESGPAIAGPAATATAADETAWVPAATLWRDRFETMKELAKFRENHPDMFRNPSPRRLKIHAGKWTAFWASRDKAGFEALDGNLQSVADDPDVQEEAIAGAMQRAAAIRAKKRAGKS